MQSCRVQTGFAPQFFEQKIVSYMSLIRSSEQYSPLNQGEFRPYNIITRRSSDRSTVRSPSSSRPFDFAPLTVCCESFARSAQPLDHRTAFIDKFRQPPTDLMRLSMTAPIHRAPDQPVTLEKTTEESVEKRRIQRQSNSCPAVPGPANLRESLRNSIHSTRI